MKLIDTTLILTGTESFPYNDSGLMKRSHVIRVELPIFHNMQSFLLKQELFIPSPPKKKKKKKKNPPTMTVL